MPSALNSETTRDHFAQLTRANRRFAEAYPGERADRQPVHTVYGGAHLFTADTAPKLGAAALRAFEEYAPDFPTFGRALGLQGIDALPSGLEDLAALRVRLAQDPEAVHREHRSAWLAH